MKRFIFSSLVCFVSITLFSQSDSYFLSNPTLTPDGQTVIFAFEGDLWKANVNDGNASRLTAMQGYETSPRVSPDGKWIAFSGRQYGNADVYIMSLNGGGCKADHLSQCE
jgi:Tol biopolymer transport system component